MNCTHVLLILVVIKTCIAYKILCLLPYPGKSHYMVFDPLLKELVHRGHNLTVVSFFPSANAQMNRRDVNLAHLAPVNVEMIDMSHFDNTYYGLARYVEHIPVSMKLAKMNLELCEKLLDAEVFKEFVDAKGDYDVILTEHFNSDCMLGIVHKYGLPSIGLMSCAVMPFTFYRIGAPENPSYVPGMTLPFTDKMSFLERLENTIVLYFYTIWFEISIRWKEQAILERKLGRTLPLLEEIGKNASAIIVNTQHSLNGVRMFTPSVVEVGGIHLYKRSVNPLRPDIEEWVSGAKNGFILFSFGSLIKGSTLPKERLKDILQVFSRLTHKVLWKWESEEAIELPDNVRLMKWLPQFDLLNHPNCVAFISHAGLLSLTEAVAVGVPMLAIPFLGDQFGNAAHAESVGVAKVLSLRDLNEDTFERALKEVLDKKMQVQAKRFSEIWKDNPIEPMEKAIYYIEKIARYGGLELSSDGRFLNRLQLCLLDIMAFLTLVILIVFLLLTWLCKVCFKRKLKTQ